MFTQHDLLRAVRNLALAAALALPHVAHANGSIDSIVVKYSTDTSTDATMSVDLQQRLADRLQSGFAATGRARDGAYRIVLNPPMTLGEAREALARIRMDKRVLYASVVERVRSAQPAPRSTVDASTTNGIIVSYRDTAVAAALRAGQVLPAGGVDRIASIAGEPVAFVRAMHNGAAVLQMFRSLSLDDVRGIAARIAQQPDVAYAQPDYRVFAQLAPTDPCYASASVAACGGNFQWDLFEAVGGVNMPPAWDVTTGSAIQRVTVIDTGFLPHPDLDSRIVSGYDFINRATTANDSDPVLNCYPNGPFPCSGSRDADAFDAGDWITASDSSGATFGGSFLNCFVSNSSWHGTHVAGTIGAMPSNGSGIAGINWVSTVSSARVLGKCGGRTSDVADAIVWASGGSVPSVPPNTQPSRVLNMSLGGWLGPGNTCQIDDVATQNAINVALANGSVVVVSAGNDDSDAVEYSPASCNGVITVASTTRNGGRAYYSNFGSNVHIAAPGGGRTANDGTSRNTILSTLNSGATTYNPSGFVFQSYQGTSMAAPHVAGIASLMLSIGPELTPGQVSSLIQSTARPFPVGTLGDCVAGAPIGNQRYCGAGIIDAAAAAQAALRNGGIARANARRDFNGNDRSDITWFNTSSGEKVAWLMKGTALAGGGSLLTAPNWQILHYGDFNRDGATDLVWRDATTGQTAIWLMSSATFIDGGVLLADVNWVPIRIGDFNGDGRTDMLWRNSATGEVVMWLMNGTSITGSATLLTDPAWIPALTGDFNADGNDDILWRNTTSGQTVIWLMNGTSYAGGGAIMTDGSWTATNLGDFNGDGKADILWRNASGATAVWLMNGAGLLAGSGLLSDPNWFVAGVDDLNGDGKSDILWRNNATGASAAWIMNGVSLNTGTGLLPGPWLVTRTGDFNGDGMADILWSNPVTNEKVMWLMNGLTVISGATLLSDPSWALYP